MIPSYPSIFTIGSYGTDKIDKGVVEITEKIDGSMFAFGKNEKDGIVMRSKGQQIFTESVDKMFQNAVDTVTILEDKIDDFKAKDIYIYCEYLSKPKHNVLSYERVPVNHLIVFGCLVDSEWIVDYEKLKEVANYFGLETVPLLFSGVIENNQQISGLMDKMSVLGKEPIEGFVIKNYTQSIELRNKITPLFCKVVREQFKERHDKAWKTEGLSGKGKLDLFIESFRTEARWRKAIQHLRDSGELEIQPRDIGKLIVEIQRDLVEEESENIKETLYRTYIGTIKRKAIAGFPEFYKEELAKNTEIGEK